MMSVKEIKKFIELLKSENLASLHYKNEEFEITLHAQPQHVIETQSVKQEVIPAEDTHTESINAPLVGTFYARATPDDEPFVVVGQHINKGEVVCILESMKVMNEIKADKSGTVSEILVQDGAAVSYDQPLFKLS